MEFTASELWSQVLTSVRAGMPEQSYRTWLAGSTAVGLADDYFGFSVAIDDDVIDASHDRTIVFTCGRCDHVRSDEANDEHR